MSLRNDLPDLIISLSNFQDFDHGEDVEELIFDNRWSSLQAKDVIYWECANFYGTALIVERRENVLIVRKLT